MNRAPTFDESWHRVEDRRVRLRPGVEIFPQRFRGRRWYVVRDALGNRFFRIRPPAYRFICELERCTTVGEAWERTLDASPEEAPGQGEVVQLLSQLHRGGLLRSDLEGDVQTLFEAQEKEHRQKVAKQWASLLFIRIPLFNPDPFLKRTLPYVGWMISRGGFLVWLALLFLGGKALVENWPQFRAELGGVLGAANLPWLYLTMVVIKGFHEFGHGYFCRKFGGEVPQMGIMLLLLNPLPFVDASSSWAFRRKSRRILVAAAGIIVEFAIAAVAVLVWVNSGEGLVHSVAHNAVLVASISTILFNMNPLLRFDGYHILSDILEVPNLQKRASRTTLYLVERFLFKLPTAVNPAETRTETFWLVFYFICVFIYRIFLLVGIVLLVSKWFFFIGVLLAVTFGFLWLVVPVLKAVAYLVKSPRVQARRGRALGICGGAVCAILALCAFVPLPSYFRANGVIRSDPYAGVFAGSPGVVIEVIAVSGELVTEGTPLVRLSNFELLREIDIARADLEGALVRERDALARDQAQRLSLAGYIEAAKARLRKLEDQREELVVTAPASGRWIAPDLITMRGSTIGRGRQLGVVQGEGDHYLAAEVGQSDVSRLFGESVPGLEVKVRGQEKYTMAVASLRAIPAEQHAESERASSPAARAGMRERVAGVDPGLSALSSEPIFEVRAFLDPQSEGYLLHGQQAVARFELPWEPLLSRWARSLRQLFQRNYRV
jgi:putative peptide zinc metalloprotease protein